MRVTRRRNTFRTLYILKKKHTPQILFGYTRSKNTQQKLRVRLQSKSIYERKGIHNGKKQVESINNTCYAMFKNHLQV